MSYQMILAPLFVQVLLTFIVAYMLAGNRARAVKRDELAGPVSLREANIITRHADLFFVLMAWVFVTLRVIHAIVHVTNNKIRLRGAFFVAGAIVLTIMWVVFIVRIMLGLP
jgi:hypothetical protein